MSANSFQPWLDKAQEDLTVARLLLKEEHTAHACFNAQQCVEKSLKAFLIAKTNSHPRIHHLVDLLDQCRSLETSFAMFYTHCLKLDEYYVPTRYPEAPAGMGPSGTPSPAEAAEALMAADTILQFVTQRLVAP